MKRATINKVCNYKFGKSLYPGTKINIKEYVYPDGIRYVGFLLDNDTLGFGIMPDSFTFDLVTDQSILLPESIVNEFTKTEKNISIKQIERYGCELVSIGIILSDNYMEELYEKQGMGYMCAIETLSNWAVEFLNTYAHVKEWEEFIITQTKYNNVCCWDDVVISFGREKLNAI